MGIISFSLPKKDPPVVIPIFLPMNCSMSPPLLCNEMETISDMANAFICPHTPQCPHPLSVRAHLLPVPLITPACTVMSITFVATLSARDSYLHEIKAQTFSYIDVFVDDLLGSAQGPIPLHLQSMSCIVPLY